MIAAIDWRPKYSYLFYNSTMVVHLSANMGYFSIAIPMGQGTS